MGFGLGHSDVPYAGKQCVKYLDELQSRMDFILRECSHRGYADSQRISYDMLAMIEQLQEKIVHLDDAITRESESGK